MIGAAGAALGHSSPPASVNEGHQESFLSDKILAPNPGLNRNKTIIGDEIDYRTVAHRDAMDEIMFRPRQRMNSNHSSSGSDSTFLD